MFQKLVTQPFGIIETSTMSQMTEKGLTFNVASVNYSFFTVKGRKRQESDGVKILG